MTIINQKYNEMDESEYQVQQTDFPNFKGVMLCARPEERQNIQREKLIIVNHQLETSVLELDPKRRLASIPYSALKD